jgi:hypothetical protein
VGAYDRKGRVGKTGKLDSDGNDGIPASMRILSIVSDKLPVPRPVAPATFAAPLPEGWIMEVATPIHYRASGYCTGGTFNLIVGARTYAYRATPPLCELTLES